MSYYWFLFRHHIRCLRLTLTEIDTHVILHTEENQGNYYQVTYNGIELSVIYYRSGYTPDDYFGPKEWSARLLLERSFAIKCPSIAYHLVGCKKVSSQ